MRARRATVAGVILVAACSGPGELTDSAVPGPSPTSPSASPTATDPPPSPSASPTAPDPPPSPTATAPSPTATAPSPTEPAQPPPATAAPSTPAPFRSSVSEVVGHPAEERMVGVSWREGCPVPLEQLRYLTVSHVGMDGAASTGELVVRADVVDDVLAALQRMYELGFPIERMRLVSDYGADDGTSMRANNTSAFNCRHVAGTQRWSNHAHGVAIDINPLRNPYVRGDSVDPPEGAPYADRSDHRPGMLHPGTPEVAAWTDLGWDWGGTWSSGQDYQHFSATGG